MRIVYTTKKIKAAKDIRVIDPATFQTPEDDATIVYYDGDNLKLKFGYETRGITVRPLTALKDANSKKGQ